MKEIFGVALGAVLGIGSVIVMRFCAAVAEEEKFGQTQSQETVPNYTSPLSTALIRTMAQHDFVRLAGDGSSAAGWGLERLIRREQATPAEVAQTASEAFQST